MVLTLCFANSSLTTMTGYCGIEQYCCIGFWPRAVWARRWCRLCCNGSIFVLRRTERYACQSKWRRPFNAVIPIGSFFTSARLIYVAGKEGYLPGLFGRHNTRLKTPLNAMCLQAGLTTAFILIGGGFRSLINFAVVASWAFYFLTVSYGHECRTTTVLFTMRRYWVL